MKRTFFTTEREKVQEMFYAGKDPGHILMEITTKRYAPGDASPLVPGG